MPSAIAQIKQALLLLFFMQNNAVFILHVSKLKSSQRLRVMITLHILLKFYLIRMYLIRQSANRFHTDFGEIMKSCKLLNVCMHIHIHPIPPPLSLVLNKFKINLKFKHFFLFPN